MTELSALDLLPESRRNTLTDAKRQKHELLLAKASLALARKLIELDVPKEETETAVELLSSQDFGNKKLKRIQKHAGAYAACIMMGMDINVRNNDAQLDEPAAENVVKDPSIGSVLGHATLVDTYIHPEDPETTFLQASAGLEAATPNILEASDAPLSIDRDKLSQIAGRLADGLWFEGVTSTEMAKLIYEAAGCPELRVNAAGLRPDPVKRIERFICGISHDDNESDIGTSGASMYQWFHKLKKDIARLQQAPEAEAPTVSSDIEILTDVVAFEEPAPAAEEVAEQLTGMEQDGFILRATQRPESISTQEWRIVAKNRVSELAKISEFSDSEIDGLLERFDLGDYKEAYRSVASAEALAAITKLGGIFSRRWKARLADNGLARENVGLRVMTVVSSTGVPTVDDAHKTMLKVKHNRYEHELTDTLTRRHLVNGLVMILRHDD